MVKSGEVVFRCSRSASTLAGCTRRAFAAGDRGMTDSLTVTCDGRLVVIELKAQEMHLPLQGLDYWGGRVRWHHKRHEFQKFGYFAGCELSSRPPCLFWSHRSYICIRQPTRCFVGSLQRSNGKVLASTSTGVGAVRVVFGRAGRQPGGHPGLRRNLRLIHRRLAKLLNRQCNNRQSSIFPNISFPRFTQ